MRPQATFSSQETYLKAFILHPHPPVGYMIQLMLALSLNVDHKMINSIIFVMQFPDEYNSINPSIFALGFNVSSYRISINDLHSSCL